jgi:hypothetical protein
LPISLGSTDSSKISQINEPSDNPDAVCVLFGIGAEWGPVGKADVKLGSLTASNVRFMMIDSTYGSIPSYSGCASSTLDTSPSADGYNGIIGVGLFTTDCGADGCDPSSTSYYGCPSGTNCSLAKVGLNYTSVSSSGASGLTNNGSIATAYQVQNPIAQMPTGYNNGTAITLPSLSTCGASVVKGYMALGVASVTNNTPSTTPTIIKAASSTISGSIVAGYMYTDWNGYEYNGLIDSGTSTWAIVPNSDLSDCGGSYSGFLCPSDTPSLSASMVAADNSVTKSISFTIGNAESLFNSSNTAYPSLGTSLSSSSDLFIWGLPFFYGRTVYTVINGKTATGVGTGPLWAY